MNRTQEKDRLGVLLAHALLWIDTQREHGRVDGGPTIDVNRCEDVIASSPLEFTAQEIQLTALGFMRRWRSRERATA